MQQNSKTWYLLYCKKGQEHKAQINLANQNVESFFPKIKKNKIVRGKATLKEEALFPSYVFVALNEQSNYNAVRSTRGVIDFIKFGAKYQQVSNELIQSLQQKQCVIEDTTPKQGDKVTLNNAQFKNVEAIYKCNDGEKRSILLLNLLNKHVEVSVENITFTPN